MYIEKDVIVLARPDHSLAIYYNLLKRDSINFLFCCFKVLPSWMRYVVKNSKAKFYTKNFSCCKLLTILNIYRVRYGKYHLEAKEPGLYEFHLSHTLPFYIPKLVHYWPMFSMRYVKRLKEKHPEIKTFAEVYFPCENWVLDNMKPLYKKMGVDVYTGKIERDARKLKEVMEFEDNFLVPSKFVADTYREYYPNKNYIIIPYGIQKWAGYKKKNNISEKSEVRKFVFCGGGISIEKGCDLMFDYFTNHPELELHVYGAFSPDQKTYFENRSYTSNIHLHGFVAKAKLQEEISKYDVGIHFSRYDAYSLSVSEMTGAGLPVVVSDKTGNFFQLQEIGAGLVTKLEIEDIENKIEHIREPQIYNKMLDNIDQYLERNVPTYGEQIIEFYKQQLNER